MHKKPILTEPPGPFIFLQIFLKKAEMLGDVSLTNYSDMQYISLFIAQKHKVQQTL